MVSSKILFSAGLIISVVSLPLWGIILRSQFKQYHSNHMNVRIKKALIIFGFVSMFSNLMPIWFDIYQLSRHPHVTNIGIAYTTSQYLFRAVATSMFFVIYRSR